MRGWELGLNGARVLTSLGLSFPGSGVRTGDLWENTWWTPPTQPFLAVSSDSELPPGSVMEPVLF